MLRKDRQIRIGLTLILFTAALLLPLSGICQSKEDDEAVIAFNNGVEYFKNERYDEAVAAFRQAYELKPSWKIKYNIGQCEAARKRYGLAIEAFEAYLGVGGDEVPEKRQEMVLKELRRLRQMIGSIKVNGPEGVEIYVDGVLRGVTPINSPIPVTAGIEHTIAFVRGWERIREFKETIVGGQITELDITTPKVDNTADSESGTVDTTQAGENNSQAEESAQEAPEGKPLKPAIFILGVSVAVIFGGATLAFALVSEKMWEDAEYAVQYEPWEYDPTDKNTIKGLHIGGYVSLGLAAIGVITAATAAPFTYWKGKRNSKQGDNSLSFSFWNTRKGGGLLLKGRF